VSDSVPGRWADIKLLKASRLMKRLPKGTGGPGDLGDVGIRDLHPLGACPVANRVVSRARSGT
jgi:hypothetical protein